MSQPGQEANAPQFVEQRTLERTYEEMDAVYMPEGSDPVHCRLLDFSMMGARMEFAEARVVPDVISIEVPKFSLTYLCEVRWQNGNEIGLMFNSAERTEMP